MATHEPFRSFVEERGLRFVPIAGDPQEMIRTPRVQTLLASGRNPVAMLRGFADLLDDVWPEYVATTTAACQGQEAILYTALGFSVWHIGEAAGVPTGMLALAPFGPTRAHLPASVFAGRSFGRWLNRLGHAGQQRMAWQLVAGRIDRWRTEELGLPPLGRRGLLYELRRRAEPIIHGYSPAVAPRPADWPDWYQDTGWWFLERPAEWAPPDSLVEFLEAGPPPVYAGFGSMVDARAPELSEAVVDAFVQAGRRGVVATGWGGLEPGLHDASVFATDYVPHSWLLPQVSAAIHHGGAGTTGAVIRAGVPHVVAPVFGDQHFWARTVRRLGVAAEVDRNKASKLRAALAEAEQPDVRERARRLAEVVNQEDGVAAGVKAIERWVLTRA